MCCVLVRAQAIQSKKEKMLVEEGKLREHGVCSMLLLHHLAVADPLLIVSYRVAEKEVSIARRAMEKKEKNVAKAERNVEQKVRLPDVS